MTYEFRLPDIGEGVVEGEVVRWLVKEGDQLTEDQPLVEIMTDKATVEIPAPRAGRVQKRFFAEGQVCPVGSVLISIELEDKASAPAEARAPETKATTGPAAAPAAARAASVAGGAPVARASEGLATPATRKLARELGVDIRAVGGTGRAGRITSDDVRGHQPGAGAAAPGDGSSSPAATGTVAGGTPAQP